MTYQMLSCFLLGSRVPLAMFTKMSVQNFRQDQRATEKKNHNTLANTYQPLG